MNGKLNQNSEMQRIKNEYYEGFDLARVFAAESLAAAALRGKAANLGLTYDKDAPSPITGLKAAIGTIEVFRAVFREFAGGGFGRLPGARELHSALESAAHTFARSLLQLPLEAQEDFLHNAQILLALLKKTDCRLPGGRREKSARKCAHSKRDNGRTADRGKRKADGE